MSARRTPQATAPWPDERQLEQMGLTRCPEPACTTYIDPVNLPGAGGRCQRHRRRERPREDRASA